MAVGGVREDVWLLVSHHILLLQRTCLVFLLPSRHFQPNICPHNETKTPRNPHRVQKVGLFFLLTQLKCAFERGLPD